MSYADRHSDRKDFAHRSEKKVSAFRRYVHYSVETRDMDKRSDHDLLSEFAANASETAFATLVDRHIGMVYSAAFRHLNDSHLAEDVAQAVFVLLARKASTISKNTILTGWLYRTARFVSADVLKTETRRRKREQNAAETSNPATAPSEKAPSEKAMVT